MKTFAERLQSVIDDRKISQRDLADSLEINEARISEWLSGKVGNPRRTTLLKIADFFGCNVNWLADGTGKPFHEEQETKERNQAVNISQHDGLAAIKEIVSMVLEIYESDTEYKSALEASIRAFHSAIKTDNEMNNVKQDMGQMKKRMERVEQLLLTLTEKRDKAANS